MDGAPGEREQEQVHAAARADALGQQTSPVRQRAGLELDPQQRLHGAHLRALARMREQAFDLARQLGGQRHAPALPGRHRSVAALGAAHVGRHAFQPHQFQRPAGKLEVPSPPPRKYFPETAPSAVMVPIDSRCRSAMRRSWTR
ncbi:hypothetical protein G6F59_016707 [Rhizopus arrhizus]|nr:hypothetical protein G6F59_016707 [Rhizopus arrhizus]